MPTILTSFDRPRMSPNCVERSESTVATQALHLMNNQQVSSWSAQFAQRVFEGAGEDQEKQVRLAFLKALSRQPDQQELSIALEYMEKMASRISGANSPADLNFKVLSRFCHALINSAAYIYID
tara:strand:- start:92 stop:463 length:372 start_codon:yes stop_codon:yes gene_type:complete